MEGHLPGASQTLFSRVPVAAPMTSFWTRVEDKLLALQKDRARLARWFVVAYWVSTAFVVVGVVLILLFVLRGGLQ